MKLQLKYSLDEKPPLVELLLFGLQWLAIIVPTIIIIGKVVAGLHFADSSLQIMYLQKLFFLTGIALLAQIFWGHRLPLIIGPATVLLVGITASQKSEVYIIYSSILIGGILLFFLSITGLFAKLKYFFTTRVVATILILIAFTLTPMILNLLISTSTKVPVAYNLIFSLLYIFSMFTANRFLRGIWKATLVIWAILIGSILYSLLFTVNTLTTNSSYLVISADFLRNIDFSFRFEPSIVISFLICFLALSINDLGSIQAVGEVLQPENMNRRITKGMSMTGLLNIFSGLFGVIGPVNFSLSPGVIASTGVASRFTLIPAGVGLFVLAFLPKAIAIMGGIPSTIIGSTLVYIMTSQIAAGLMVAFKGLQSFKMEHGLIMGLPLMLSIIISFLPANVISSLPANLRPILGNGFVIGVLGVLIMEHIIYRKV